MLPHSVLQPAEYSELEAQAGKRWFFSLCSTSVELGDLGRYLQAVQEKMDVEWFLLSAKKVKGGKKQPSPSCLQVRCKWHVD